MYWAVCVCVSVLLTHEAAGIILAIHQTLRNQLKIDKKKMQMWQYWHSCIVKASLVCSVTSHISFNEVKNVNRRKRSLENAQIRVEAENTHKKPPIKTGPLLHFGFRHTHTPHHLLVLSYISELITLNKRFFSSLLREVLCCRTAPESH